MATYELIARVDRDASDDTTFTVRSPAVGVADGVPADGEYLNPLEGFLSLTVMNRRYVVRLPRDVQGRVIERFIDDTYTPVGYDQPLFRLSQTAESEAHGAANAAGRQAGQLDSEGGADLIVVAAPSEGVFYRRPGPDSPAYVEEGAEVTAGTVLGLVEVMKSFNQITYGAPGLPDRGIVVRILAEDAAEVAFGQRLFLIRPA